MGTSLPFTWQDDLERLRREQDPSRYPPLDDRPNLQLPVPLWDPPPQEPPPEKEPPRILIIDL